MILLSFSNKYGFVSVTNFLMICEKHSYLQLCIKLGIWSLILNLNTCTVINSTVINSPFENAYKVIKI